LRLIIVAEIHRLHFVFLVLIFSISSAKFPFAEERESSSFVDEFFPSSCCCLSAPCGGALCSALFSIGRIAILMIIPKMSWKVKKNLLSPQLLHLWAIVCGNGQTSL
jgi:hypothetical protein